MIVVDTTVLVYAVGAEHPLRQPCRDLIARIGAGEVAATTTVEVIQEFAHVRARRRTAVDAASVSSDYATLLAPLLRPDEEDLGRGLELFAAIGGLGAFDAVLAATVMRSERLTALVSADRSFALVDGLDHRDPADPGALAFSDPEPV